MKRLFLAMCICSLALTGCTPNEKTTVLEDDVLITDVNYSNKIKKEKVDINLEDGYVFKPGFFYEDKIYGISGDMNNADSKAYGGYYSKADGFVKEKEMSSIEPIINNKYNHRITISSYLDSRPRITEENTIKIRDNATGEIIVLPTFEALGNEIRISLPNNSNSTNSNNNNNISNINSSGNTTTELLNFQLNPGENSSISNVDKMVVGNNDYGYSTVSRNVFAGNEPGYEYLNGKFIMKNCTRSYNSALLYDCKNNQTITYGGNLSAESFPSIQSIIYNDKNNTFYALAGELENQLYKLTIKDNKYDIELIYTFDLGERSINIWDSKIINGYLVLDSYILVPSDDEGGAIYTEEKVLLFNLSTMEFLEGTVADNVTSRLLPSNSNKYFIVNNYDTDLNEGKTLLATIKDDKIQYLYNFELAPIFTVMDEENKRLFVSSLNEKGDLECYLYNIDID